MATEGAMVSVTGKSADVIAAKMVDILTAGLARRPSDRR